MTDKTMIRGTKMKGFTLIELIIGIVPLCIIVGGLYTIIHFIIKFW